ncbi:ATP-grasp domain-containing protein [Myceligenerans crystallogenes]|uniref:ATP-grasp domain-containing protein n=1 Tax=Myceligenerans crystallogenes TaxID=316335 RepID=A0ABP4ZGJ9_9MICO
MKILLIMRATYKSYREHLRTLLGEGLEIHLVTGVADARDDHRFANVVPVAGMSEDEVVDTVVRYAKDTGIGFALTFWEADIVVTARVNEYLGQPWANVAAARTARDKSAQRRLLADAGLPSVEFRTLGAGEAGDDALSEIAGWADSVVVKPARLAASVGVKRVTGHEALREAVADIRRVAGGEAWLADFVTDDPDLVVVEEYLPGREVTVDGVVVDGRFHLAGITNKMAMDGPYFEEDYYTLPYRFPEEEGEITGIVQGVVDALGLVQATFNIELRQDAAGRFRVIEFSPRMSGGQNYLNLRTAHGFDLVRVHVRAASAGGSVLTEQDLARHPGRAATCIKFAYRGGRVVRNNAGEAAHSRHFLEYTPSAAPGKLLRQPPEAWYEVAGSLAVAVPFRGLDDIDRVERVADDLDRKLDVVTTGHLSRSAQ